MEDDNMAGFRKSLKITVIALAVSLYAAQAIALAPTDQVRDTIEQVTAALREARASRETGNPELQAKLRGLLLPRFDFAEMAKRSLGKHWADHQNRQDEFVPAFVGFVENAYIGSIQSFKGENIIYVREIVEKDLAEVHTKVVPGSGEQVAVNYRLRLVNDEWKVYDVVIENISLVNNFRSQFNRILNSASFDELLKKLQERRAEQKS
jgi:phospholipid transport system substrate-binding protein